MSEPCTVILSDRWYDHYEIRFFALDDAVQLRVHTYFRTLGLHGQVKVLPDLTMWPDLTVYVQPPNIIERLFGLTWSEKINRTRQKLDRRARLHEQRTLATEAMVSRHRTNQE